MSVLALLLNADTKKIEEKQTKKMEIPRLSAAQIGRASCRERV